LDDQELEGGDVLCSEGTRRCRNGVWSGCEDVRQYIFEPSADTQRVIDPSATNTTCNVCDKKCFQVVDHLLSDGGVAGGNVTFGPGGGITLLPGDGGAGSGDGGTGLTGCPAMRACCWSLSDALRASCLATANAGDNTICNRDRPTYCPSGTVTGPLQGCTLGSGADIDCDGIPNEVDSTPGTPLATTNNQTIFHQLDNGETGSNAIDISFKLKNADVYFLLDMTNTMKEERDNLISSLTTGNVINCAHLNQCCNRLTNAATKQSCKDALASYTNRPNQADDQAQCLTAQMSYCPGNKTVDCPDNDLNGAPDNHLKTQGVVGATRCLVGSAWFGAGFSREAPIQADPSGCSGNGCSTKYADRDEQLFKNSIDMTADYTKVLTALQSMQTNGNWDDPEGGMMALHSVITGRGHYFGINRPSIPPRDAATQCPPNTFGYPCFRKDAVPIVVFFTDRPHHNGPPDATNCNNEGAGCPYNRLSGVGTTSWTSAANESSSDQVARFVPSSAETFATAYNAGDLRGQYLTLVGDTRFMAGDYPTALIGCGAPPTAPDALIRFRITPPPGAPDPTAPIPINFHLTKNDGYSNANLYGTWRTDRTNDPSPATEFGSVISVFRGQPSAVTGVTNLGDSKQFAIASGPDSTYLTYTGTTMGSMSAPGFLGGISNCAADGLTNQMVFTFKPNSNVRIVVDASESGFGTVVSLHEGLPGSLPKNPNTMDGTSAGIANTNDTFATANAVPSGATSIDGAYVERKGDTNVGAITANYTMLLPRTIYGKRTTDSDTLTGITSTAGIEPGMELSSSAHWTTTPVRVVSVDTNTIKLSGKWEGDPPPDPLLGPQTDPAPLALSFLDTLVGCGVDPAGKDTVFQFNVATPRRVRIDTEGSTYDTVISLHDAPPPTLVSKSDVAGNATAPGYQIGEVNNTSYTLDALGMGTGALTSNYDYAQCGAGKSSKDAVFRFTLDRPTRVGLDVTSPGAFDPIVGLFSSPPGNVSTLSNTANNNDNLTAPRAAFDLGDIYGAVDTKVTGSDLAGMSGDWDAAVVGCGAYTPGRDQVFKFTPLSHTRARIKVTPNGSAWNPVVAVFDDPPPSNVAVTTTAVFDAAAITLPDTNCLAYSYHDPALAAPAHTYAVCPTKYYSNDANVRCVSAGMNYLASINSAAEQSFIMTTSVTSYLGNKFHIGAVDPEGDNIFVWRDATGLTYNNWVSGEPNGAASNNKCAVLSSDASGLGQWSDGKCTSSGAAAADNTYYICEDVAPAVLPNEDAATAFAIPPATTRVVTGSTRRMSNDYNGATLLSACDGTSFGGDAVFSITTGMGTSYELGIDSAGSSFNVVLGLFETTIDGTGYRACDAAGGGTLTYTLLPSRTYYVLVKGTALSQEGTYKLKFTNLSAPVASGTQLSCAKSTPSVPTGTTDVDVDANHTYYVVVDQADAAFGKYDLEVNSLYQSRNELGNAASANETGENALSLPDPYRSRVTVVDTSTAGMSADYGNGTGGMCSASPSAPDAVYKFTPSLSTNVTFKVEPHGPTGLNNVAIGVFDGPPGTSAVTHNLNATGNLNEAGPSAELVSLTGPAQLYLGNTSAMAANVDASLLACGARPNGHDAVFKFTLAQQTNVEIDASASGVTDPVINLFGSGPLSRPAQVTLENDTKLSADSNPTPTPSLGASWLYYGGDLSNLSAESQAPVSRAAVNDDTPPGTLQPQDLGDVSGKRVVISGGDTGPMRADYRKLTCAGVDGAADALYKFTSSTTGLVHIKATPASGFDGVIGLFDGTNGLPVRLSDTGSLTEDAACVPPNGPKNLTNTTLKSISTMLGAAPAINLNCGLNSAIVTNDPDGSGPALVAFQNWCGTQPTVLLQQQPDGAELVVIITNSFAIANGARLRVLGERPVLFVVNGTATIAGELNTSPEPASYPGIPGAGGDIGCGTSYGGNALSSGNNSGGGGGGGFATVGGIGGFGSSSSVLGGVAGTVRSNSTLVPLVGGCSGGDGAFGSVGGLAAGAVQISATTSITLAATGAILADGGVGATGASGQGGGTGGGSGGAILLQAPTVTYMAAQLSARGGNGGGGLGSPATTGGTGAATNAAAGGVGQDSNAAAGGGGGGGGYGRVVIATGAMSLAQCTVATNEAGGSAWSIPLDGSGREFIERGNTSTMTSDHGGVCGTSPSAPDAVYAFTLSTSAQVKIDGAGSTNGTTIALFNASSLGNTPAPTPLENDDRAAADANPTPTPDVNSNWLRYSGDLQNLTASSQPQTTVDNSGNFNEIIPTELPNPIDRRITVTNANTSAMTADYLAATCSMPAADNARDAIYRFVPSKDGQVRVSANYSQTAFNPVIALYQGMRGVIDERVLLVNQIEGTLAQLGIDVSTITVRNLSRSVLYTTADYTVVARDANTPFVIKRTVGSAIPSGVEVSVDYSYDSGPPLPISQQQVTSVNLGAGGNTNENALSAQHVPIESGRAYVYTGDTTAMSVDVNSSLFTCGSPDPASRDATFSFSLDKPTTVSITTEGSSYDTNIGVFSGSITRPSTSLLRAPAPVLTQLYDVRLALGYPESTCSLREVSGVAYWFCSTARTWEQAEGMCRSVGLHLVTIDSATENNTLQAEIASGMAAYHIGFTEAMPYTNSWGTWTSGGGDTTGAAVAGRYNRWTTNEPNGSGDCLQLLSDGFWDDADCALPKNYVCERNDTTPTSAPPGGTCGSVQTYGGHLYYVCTDKQDWATASSRCSSVGMRLARIDDQPEDDQLRTLVAGNPAWIGGSDSTAEGAWIWADSTPFWTLGAYRNWATGEPNSFLTNPGSRIRPSDGKWEDTPITSQTAPYICEDMTPPSGLSTPPTASSPQLVNAFSPRRQFTGSTQGVTSSVAGFIGCGSAAAAPDAVFQLQLTYQTTLDLDISNSFSGAIVGLFRDEISSTGYSNAGSRCGLVGSAAPQLSATIAAGTYYVVITGATAGSSGVYNLSIDARTSDAAVFTMNNDTLQQAIDNPLGSVDGKWLVKKTVMTGITPTMGSSTTVDMGAGMDPNDVVAQSLGTVNDTRVSVSNASTVDLAADFTPGSCNAAANGPDALYSFVASGNDPVQVRFTPSGWAGQVVLYDGAPPTIASLPSAPVSLAPGYTNEAPASAQSLTIGAAQAYLGSLTTMANNVPSAAFNQSFNAGSGSPMTCNADAAGSDAYFKLTVSGGPKNVEISSANTAVAHTIALWDTKPFVKPTSTAMQYETRAAANMVGTRLGSGGDIDDDWVVVTGDTSTLAPYNSYTSRTETVDYPRDDTVHALGNVNGLQVRTVNATTAGLAADYTAPTMGCSGTSDTTPDAAFSFSHSAGAKVRVALNNPNPFFAPTVSLFKGAPLTAAMINPAQVATGNTNELLTNAYVTDPVAAARIFTGNTSAMANGYSGTVFTQGSAYGSKVCTPEAAGRDAFVKFTLASTKTVEISSLAANFNQTIALWDSTPIVAPAAAAMSHDTRNAAYLTPIGIVDNEWIVKSATMSGLWADAVTASTPTVASTDEVQDLGSPVGKRIAVSGNTSSALADFTAGASEAVTCGTSNTAPDIIYKVRPTVNTTIRASLNNPSAPTNAHAIAVLDGSSGHPKRMIDTTPAASTTTYCAAGAGFGYTPSNLTVGSGAGQANVAAGPTGNLTCGTTVTFNSTTNTWTGYCAAQTQPTAVVQAQASGPDLVILPFKSLNLGSTTTIKLVGTRPVAFAVEGNVTIAGTIDASASGTTAGAGGDWSCGSADGNDGTGDSSSGGGGGGGGAFGTNGGSGGYGDDNGNQGAGGTARGNANITPLYGGCNGGRGGGCSALGAAGGGAVQISAGAALTVSGSIVANGGAGATGCGSEGGGTGGGSGGGIFLEGVSISVTGALTANGGRGGNGDGNGGNGSTSNASPGSVGASDGTNGGAGGGGGYGRIRQRVAPCVTAIEDSTTAQDVTIGLTQTYTGPINGMASNYPGTQFNTTGCAPDASGLDAFWKFTLTRTTDVNVSAQGTAFNHTLTLFNSTIAAQQCNDGNSTTGGTITRSLAAGTYYVGIKTRSGATTGSFTVALRDTTAGPAYSASMGCALSTGTGSVDASLTANTDYFIIVKGASGTLSGAYNLVVTDITNVQSSTCGEASAPDAYFDFEVNDAAGRNITVELNETGGRLDGSFQLMRDAGTLNVVSDDVAVGTCQTSSTTYNALAKGRYYVVVRGAAVPGTSAAEISIKDLSGSNALDCADANSGAAATITKSLPAGTYYAGITSRSGGSAGGAYSLQIRDTSVAAPSGGTLLGCADATTHILDYTIPPADAGVLHYVVVKGRNAGGSGTYGLTVTDLSTVQDLCDVGDSIQMDPTAPDAYYAFNVTDSDGGGRDVTVSLASTSALDGAYRLFRAGTPNVAMGSCHDKSAPFNYADLAAGNYYLALRGKSVASGGANAAFELSVNDQDAYGSLLCSNGAATTGTTITRSLSNGDYFVGIKPQPGALNPKDYKLQFRDTAVVAPVAATQIDCQTSVINATVTAGKTYHVLVKGDDASAKGTYGLSVADLGISSSWNCNDDPYGGDAFFELNVDDPAGRTVTIDTEGSTLDTVVAIFAAGSPITAAGKLDCNDDGGATAGSSKITRLLTPGVYYVVVRPKLGAANPIAPFELSVRDDNAYGSVACAATAGAVKAQIKTTLGPGTYYTVLKGKAGSAQGPYQIRFRDETPYENAASQVQCDTDKELNYVVTAGKPYYAIVKGAANDQSGAYRLTVDNMVARNGMGCNASDLSPDAVYRFHLSEDRQVQIDTIGSPTDTVIALYDSSATFFGTNYATNKLGTPVNCDDDSAGSGWSKIVADLAGNRDYYVVVKSKSSGWGGGSTVSLPYLVSVKDMESKQPIACTSTSMTETLSAGDYRVVVSTTNGTTGAPFNVSFKNVTAASSGATQLACADSPEEFTYNVTAGVPYYVMVKGDAANDRGQYGLVVETAGTGATSMGCGASPEAPDAFFKFDLAAPATIELDTENSTVDTVMALYAGNTTVFGSNYTVDVNGALVPCDDDGGVSAGASRIQAQLAAGSYYVVVKGKTVGWNTPSQAFNLSLRDLTNSGSIACASSSEGNKRIVQNLAPGDYQVVMATTGAAGGAYSLKFRDTDLSGVQNGAPVSCVASGSLTVNNLAGGHEYYVVVKGNTASDSGGYTLTMEDTVSASAASGSTSIACAAENMMIEGTYPAGTYYALVTGKDASDSGPYTLKVRDLDALQDQNRLACDDNGGPNNTSVIERDLKAGMHYVVVKGNGESARGAYSLHVRDVTAVPDHELACAGDEQSERLQADVRANQDYTVVLKGDAAAASGAYNIKLYDQSGLSDTDGQNVKCVADPQPATLAGTDWHRSAVNFDLNLKPDTYYVAVKGRRATDKGTFQLQIGEKSARTTTTYTPPVWSQIQDALETSAARVLPVIATGGDTTPYVPAAEAQAKAIALASNAVKDDGTPIWQKIQKTGRGTGSGLITGIAELANYLAMDVSLDAIDGPDPGASKFEITIAPVNSASCDKHPLVDINTGACTGGTPTQSCNTQYNCLPGSAPKFTVTFTNPSNAPVEPNMNDPYGGYHFRLRITGDKQYLLDEVPVYIIPTNHAPMGPPGGGMASGYEVSGTYEQDILSAICPLVTDLPQWSDMFVSAGMPEGTSMDIELCTKDKTEDLAGCVWSNGGSGTRKKVTVRSQGTCNNDNQCRNVVGFGSGFCSAGICQFITEPKVAHDVSCSQDNDCPNGPLGAGDYVISSRCETTPSAYGYGYCVYTSLPADMGATLLSGEQGRPFARVRFTLRSDTTKTLAPTLFEWNMRYFCKSAQ